MNERALCGCGCVHRVYHRIYAWLWTIWKRTAFSATGTHISIQLCLFTVQSVTMLLLLLLLLRAQFFHSSILIQCWFPVAMCKPTTFQATHLLGKYEMADRKILNIGLANTDHHELYLKFLCKKKIFRQTPLMRFQSTHTHTFACTLSIYTKVLSKAKNETTEKKWNENENTSRNFMQFR